MYRILLIIFLPLSLLDFSGCFVTSLFPESDSGLLLPSPLEGRDETAFLDSCAEDLRAVERSGHAMAAIVAFLKNHPALLTTDDTRAIDPSTRDTLEQIWQAFLDHLYTLEKIRLRQGSYWKIGSSKYPKAHAASFNLFALSFMIQNYYGAEFTALFAKNPKARILLEEPGSDILPYSYSRLKYRVLNLLTFQTVHSLAQYGKEWFSESATPGEDTIFTWAGKTRVALEDTLLSLALSRNLKLTGLNALDIARKQAFFLIFPLQKNLADFMGQSRYDPSPRERMVKPDAVDSLEKILAPGDLILNRSNWILSNAGLPGFWPHVAFYTGNYRRLCRFFEDDSGAKAALREMTGSDTTSFETFVSSLDHDGSKRFADSTLSPPMDVIEALSSGSVPNTLRSTAHCDYLAALRPNLPSREKARAVLRAFRYLGRPYDFDFDFDTESELVCSELVYKCYQPSAPGDAGIRIPLRNILGRWTLPPNDFAALFTRESASVNPQFRLVAFLDADYRQGQSRFSPEKVFRETSGRTKWDFLLE